MNEMQEIVRRSILIYSMASEELIVYFWYAFNVGYTDLRSNQKSSIIK